MSRPPESEAVQGRNQTWQWLYAFRPRFGNWRFWAVQALVICIAGVHDFIEYAGFLPELGMLYFLPISLFFVPVVYAALNFGLAGSVATAVWALIITIPNWVFWHSGLERLGVMFQMSIIIAMAVFVGYRVEREQSARQRAEAAGAELKAYAAHILHAQEEERQRIARELHDETIQTLALLCRRLSSIESTDSSLSPKSVEEIEEARNIAEGIVGDLRDFTKALRPPILEDLGLVASIRRLLLDFSERSGIQSDISITGEEQRLPYDSGVALFRIAQEALWNVERHSGAEKVAITLNFAANEVELKIKDDGVGFKVPPVLRSLPVGGHLGLLGMHERAESLGGRFSIRSSPSKGTTIAVSIPLA